MSMTSSESQWIARVMHTISQLAFLESCNRLVEAVQQVAAEEAARAGGRVPAERPALCSHV
jgi:hypothetical protein